MGKDKNRLTATTLRDGSVRLPTLYHRRPSYPVPRSPSETEPLRTVSTRRLATYPTPRPREYSPSRPLLSQLPYTRAREGHTKNLAIPFPLHVLPREVSHWGKSRRRTAYPQQIVTTRLLYCLQDRFAQLSRLQRI